MDQCGDSGESFGLEVGRLGFKSAFSHSSSPADFRPVIVAQPNLPRRAIRKRENNVWALHLCIDGI